MAKFFIMLVIVFQCACSSLFNNKGQWQPVRSLDSKAQIFLTTCNGMAETIGTCHTKAKETCAGGYRLLSEKIDGSGIFREITFQCKT
jgi:hypothetical protein